MPAKFTPLDPESLRQFIDTHRIPHRQTSVSYIFTCPRCGKRDKLYMRKHAAAGHSGRRISTGRFICFSEECALASFAGRPEYALAGLSGLLVPEVQAALYGACGAPGARLQLPWKDDGEDDAEDAEPELNELFFPLDYVDLDHPHAVKGVEYLARRGVPAAVAKMYGVMYSPVERRVIFPVRVDGVLVGWQGRLIVPNEHTDPDTGVKTSVPKIASSRNIPPVWMFQDRLVGLEHAVLCEGPFDAIKAHACGGNVACMGISRSTTPNQVKILHDAGVRRVYLALDPDAALTTERLVNDLSDMECFRLDVPKDRDLGGMSFREVFELFRGAKRASRAQVFVYLKPTPPACRAGATRPARAGVLELSSRRA